MTNAPDARDFPLAAYTVRDPELFARNMMRVVEQGGRALSEYLARANSQSGAYSSAAELKEALEAISEVVSQWLADPNKLMAAQTELIQTYGEIWTNNLRRSFGEDIEPIVEPEPGDNRFKDEDWRTNPYFDFWKQTYLATSHWADNMLAHTKGLDEQERRRAEYYFRQILSALSPSNFPMTNPEILRETMATNAENLVNGMDLLIEDLNKSGDLLKISQTDTEAFHVGDNLAVTPGKVVFQNEIFQLIQYKPSTEKVRKTPLLVVPPWINKFYILDLTLAKSFLKFSVDQGFTVFIISWVNPDKKLSSKTFEDYMKDGILKAADAVQRETGVKKINAVGYCVGGTLLGTTLAYLAAHDEKVFRSVTFLTTQLDFTYAGDLLLFTDENHLVNLEEMMAERGYLDGSRMANVFNMMRPRDLVWPYIVNNYMLGRKPFPFDLLYWNQDSTRMPAQNHSFYLRQFYQYNNLAKGKMTIADTKLDLSKVSVPIFELATRDDHIAPAQSVYKGATLMSGPLEFVLSGSGHIAGVVNPPDKMKYQYWTNNKNSAKTLEEWTKTAEEHPGSWWPYWAEWLTKHSGSWVDPRKPGENELGTIEDAPGSYVKVTG